MIQLRTPISFEDALSAFDEPRPLSLRDEVSQRLTLPIGGVDSIGTGETPRAKLLQGNNVGGQLIEPVGIGQNIETIVSVWANGEFEYRELTFAQQVFYISLTITGMGPRLLKWWRSGDHSPVMTWNNNGTNTFAFMGTTMSFNNAPGIGESTLTLCGFY